MADRNGSPQEEPNGRKGPITSVTITEMLEQGTDEAGERIEELLREYRETPVRVTKKLDQ